MKPIKRIKLSFVITLFAFLSVLVMIPESWPATYYVDATNGNDSNPGISESTPWKTIAKVNASNFQPGDSILFRRGEIWREQLNAPSSGEPIKPITFGAYGSGALPVINGSNLLSSSWTQFSQTVWQASVTQPTDRFGNKPNQIFFDGIRGTPVTSVAAINSASKWYWTSNILYVYSTSDPAIAFTNPGIEFSQRAHCLFGNGKSYVTIQDLNLQNANMSGISFAGGAASNIIVNGLTVGHAYYHGISSQGSAETQSVTIQNCTVNWNGSCGTNVGIPSHHWTIQDNIVHNNSQVYIAGDGNFLFSGGIKGWTPADDNGKGLIIQRNKVYSQGKLPDGTRVNKEVAASGIWFDMFAHTNYTDGILITRNEVYDNMRVGIFIENGSYATVSYNLIYNNVTAWGVRISNWHHISPANYNRVYNNVIYGNDLGGITVAGSFGSEASQCIGNIVKNNIIMGNPVPQLLAEYGGENDGTMGSGNVYLNNAFGPEAPHFIQWGHNTNKDTYAAWYSTYSAAKGNTIEGDPLFISTSTPDFHLQLSSPAINAGTNVGLTSDYEGNQVPFGPAPDIGAYEYHSGLLVQPPKRFRIVP